MKKLNALTLGAAILALTGCTVGSTQLNNLFDETGVVTKETSKAKVKKLYREGVETTEDLETIEEDVDTPVVDETETVEEEKKEIASYHVDYSYEYVTKASIANRVIVDSWEKEEYSLTYVLEDNDLFLDMTLKHSYKQNEFVTGSEEVHAIYQEGRLYVTNTYTFGEFEITDKDSYRIKKHDLYYEFGDFFRQTYLDLLFVEGDKTESYNLLDVLLNKENVEIVGADATTVSIKFDYDEFEVTIVFDTELNTITGATFDHSKALADYYSDIVIYDHRPEYGGHGHEEENPANTDETTAELENLFKLEEAKEVISVKFSYNDQKANKLTEEEIESYHNYHGFGEYDHHNDHSYYGDDHGHHGGGHDSGHWGDKPGEDDYYDWDWND